MYNYSRVLIEPKIASDMAKIAISKTFLEIDPMYNYLTVS